MGNNTTENTKLDEAVKNTLNDYEAKYDAGDWSRMERMLDAAPKSSPQNWSYSTALVIGLLVIGGSYLIYKGVSSSSTDTAIENPAAPDNKTVPSVTPPPAANNVTTNTPAVNTPPANTTTGIKTATPLTNTGTAAPGTAAAIKENSLAERTKNDKKTDDTDYLKNQKVSVMGNEPVFGDMIDSSKGIIHETKEKESTKKAAKTKGSNSTIGLGSLLNMNLNLDSIKKYKESTQPDSLKEN